MNGSVNVPPANICRRQKYWIRTGKSRTFSSGNRSLRLPLILLRAQTRCLSPKYPRPRYPSPVRNPPHLKRGKPPTVHLPTELSTYLILLYLPTDYPPQTVLFSLPTGQFPNHRSPWPTFRPLTGLRLVRCTRSVTNLLWKEVGSNSDIGGYKRTISI